MSDFVKAQSARASCTQPLPKEGRLLAINFGGIGDEILFLPTLSTIRHLLADSGRNWSITLLVEPRSRSIEELTDDIDEVITFDIKKSLRVGDLLELLAMLRHGGFDAVVSSGSSPSVAILLFLSGIRFSIGYDSNILAHCLLTARAPLNRQVYAGKMYHSLAESLVQMLGRGRQAQKENWLEDSSCLVPKVALRAEAIERMSSFLRQHDLEGGRSKLVMLHPGTSRLATRKGILKTWPARSWVELAKLIQNHADKKSIPVTLVLAGGPDDQEIIEEIMSELVKTGLIDEGGEKKASDPGGSEGSVVSAYGATSSLADLAALMNLCDLLVCVDSAPMHLGVGLGKQLVALFGPTNPALLLPVDPRFGFVWDERDGNRSMFDGLGVDLPVDTVFDTVREKLDGLA